MPRIPVLALSVCLLVIPTVQAKSSKSSSGKSQATSKPDDPGCRSCVSQAAAAFASNNLDQAASQLANWTERCPANSQLHLLYSTILLRQGKMAAAEAEARLATQAQSDSLPAHLQYALALQTNNKFTQAIGEFETVTQLSPGSYEAWSALADLYKRNRQDSEAAAAAAKAANLEPGTQAVRLSVLTNLKRAKKFSQAQTEIQKLLENSELGPEFLQKVATEALEVGAYDECEKAGNKVLADYPKATAAWRTQALAQYLNHKLTQAQESCDKLLAVSPNNVDGLSIKALTLLAEGKADESAKLASQAESADPCSCFALLASGSVKLAQGQTEEGEKALNACIESDKKVRDKLPQALAHISLAQSYEKAGQKLDSLEHYRDGLALGLPPDLTKSVSESVKRLEAK